MQSHKIYCSLKNFDIERNAGHHFESPIGNKIFHRVRFCICKPFTIVFERNATTKDFSTKQTTKRLKISNASAINFIKKVRISAVQLSVFIDADLEIYLSNILCNSLHE